MKSLTAHGKIVGGYIEWRNPDYLAVNTPKFEGCDILLTIKRKWNKRSLNQNALMWKWFEIIGDYIGEDKNEVYRIMTGLYSPKVEVKMGKKVYNIPKGTSKMTKGEMVEFLFHCEKEASQLGLILPQPSDLDNSILTN